MPRGQYHRVPAVRRSRDRLVLHARHGPDPRALLRTGGRPGRTRRNLRHALVLDAVDRPVRTSPRCPGDGAPPVRPPSAPPARACLSTSSASSAIARSCGPSPSSTASPSTTSRSPRDTRRGAEASCSLVDPWAWELWFRSLRADPLPRPVRALHGGVINIHYSFPPSFAGARPYHQAHDRGVVHRRHRPPRRWQTWTRPRSSSRTSPGLSHAGILVLALQRKGQDVERRVLAQAAGGMPSTASCFNGRRTVVFARAPAGNCPRCLNGGPAQVEPRIGRRGQQFLVAGDEQDDGAALGAVLDGPRGSTPGAAGPRRAARRRWTMRARDIGGGNDEALLLPARQRQRDAARRSRSNSSSSWSASASSIAPAPDPV